MSFLVVFLAFFASTEASNWDSASKSVAVVEYRPILDTALSKEERILVNAALYSQLIGTIAPLDLIVFPENTLRTDPETAVDLNLLDNPCDGEDHPAFLRNVSCAARKAKSYVVVNLVHRVKCGANDTGTNCETHGYFFYNTNVVFGRNGQVLNLYHKYNLFGEKQFDQPSAPEVVVIETDFGLNFGIFTCFDILFKSPAQDLLARNVDAVIQPSMWYSELPFLTSLQTQQMWSHTHDIPLLAAGANNLELGSGGSGIFNGAKDASFTNIAIEDHHLVEGVNSMKVLKQSVSNQEIDLLGKEMDQFHLHIDPYVKEYSSIILDTSKTDLSEQVCHADQICCDFTAKITTTASSTEKNSYTYHLVAYSGVRSFNGFYNGGIEVCGIIACLNSSLSSCGQRFANYDDIEWPIKFEEITIKASFENDENKTQYPNSLLSSIRPIPVSQTVWEKKEVEGQKSTERTFSLAQPQDRILTFAIYGRNFAQDSPPDGNLGNAIGTSWLMMVSAIVLTIFATT